MNLTDLFLNRIDEVAQQNIPDLVYLRTKRALLDYIAVTIAGAAFQKDKLNNYVREGNSTFSPVETTNFLIRRKIVTFTGFICYVLLSIYYIVRIFIGPFFIEDYEPSIAALIAFSVLSLVVAFCLYGYS